MIDIKKQYRTRDGREVRIYAVDGVGECPVHGAILLGDSWEANTWMNHGAYAPGKISAHDLIEVKPRIQREVWVNVYPNRMGVPSPNKAYVDVHRGRDCIACVRLTIDCEEGEGL